MVTFDKDLVEEAKAIVHAALLNGLLIDMTHGLPCPTCSGDESFARLSGAELKRVGKDAVSKVFRLLWLRDNEPERYRAELRRNRRSSPD